jgi:signal transduction histidine kinase
LPTQNERFNLREFLAAVRAMLADASVLAGIPIDLAVDPTVPLELIGDAPKIRQILTSYVGNAFKHAGRGRVTVSASTAGSI